MDGVHERFLRASRGRVAIPRNGTGFGWRGAETSVHVLPSSDPRLDVRVLVGSETADVCDLPRMRSTGDPRDIDLAPVAEGVRHMRSLMTPSTADRDSARLDDDGAPVWTARQSSSADVRLAWAPSQRDNPPTGAWWPRSRNAAVELTALLPLVGDRLGGPVTRVSLNIDAWDADQPRRVRVGDCLVRLGWFHTMDPTTVTLGRGSDARATLHLVAPELDAAAARDRLHDVSTGSP